MLETYPQENMNTQAIRELTEEVFRLKQIVNEIGGGGGDLPEPTIADAGKVLGVDEQGEYALQDCGEGVFIINISSTSDDPPQIIFDKTYAQIYDAIQNKIPIFIYGTEEEEETLYGFVMQAVTTASVILGNASNPNHISLEIFTAPTKSTLTTVDIYYSIYTIDDTNAVTFRFDTYTIDLSNSYND